MATSFMNREMSARERTYEEQYPVLERNRIRIRSMRILPPREYIPQLRLTQSHKRTLPITGADNATLRSMVYPDHT